MKRPILQCWLLAGLMAFAPATVRAQDAAASTNAPPAQAAAPSTDAPPVQDAATAVMDTSSEGAPDLGSLTSPNLNHPPVVVVKKHAPVKIDYEKVIAKARVQRHEKDFEHANAALTDLLNDPQASNDFKRRALFDLALVCQDAGELVKAQQIFGQYLQKFPEDTNTPEVLLRQGLLYRQMGVHTLAMSKFYATMSTSLKLKLDSVDAYKKLVLQSQTEIADTYYMDGNFDAAADFYSRILKAGNPELNSEEIEYKLVRCLANVTNITETIARAQTYLEKHATSINAAEVRFLLAMAFKDSGRNQESLREVLELLQSQQANAALNPELWAYWQRRAGNEIANQFYREGDYLEALEIYLSLGSLGQTLAWQAPVWYQSGLIYEQLKQWQKASDSYSLITARASDLTSTNSTPMLRSLADMAQWRKNYVQWLQRAEASNALFQISGLPPSPTPAKTAVP